MIISLFAVLFLENKQYRKLVLWTMLVIWGLGLIYLLFIYRLPGGKDTGFSFSLFSIYRKASGSGWEANQALRQILFNILLYFPAGCILTALTNRVRMSLLVGINISFITEILQCMTGLGWFDFDDVLNNSIGVLMGIVGYSLLLKLKHSKYIKNEVNSL